MLHVFQFYHNMAVMQIEALLQPDSGAGAELMRHTGIPLQSCKLVGSLFSVTGFFSSPISHQHEGRPVERRRILLHQSELGIAKRLCLGTPFLEGLVKLFHELCR